VTTTMMIDNTEDIADQVIRAIEKDYGRGIARIPYCERTSFNTFEIKVVFADFTLLEAEIIISAHFMDGYSTIRVDGIYY
jgi:hypothetical protein